MNPLHSSPAPDLDDLLRRGARDLAAEPAPDLRARILSALPEVRRAPVERVVVRSPRWGSLAAAAAVLALAGGAFWWSRVGGEGPRTPPLDQARLVVASRELFDAGARVRHLQVLAADNLRDEAGFLLADATRVAERIVGGLARPLRAPLAR